MNLYVKHISIECIQHMRIYLTLFYQNNYGNKVMCPRYKVSIILKMYSTYKCIFSW